MEGKKNKKIYERWWFWVIVVLMLLFVKIITSDTSTNNTNNTIEVISEGKENVINIDEYAEIKQQAKNLIERIKQNAVGTENNGNIFDTKKFEFVKATSSPYANNKNGITLYYKMLNISLSLTYQEDTKQLRGISIENSLESENKIDKVNYLLIKTAVADLEEISLTQDNFRSMTDYNKFNSLVVGGATSKDLTIISFNKSNYTGTIRNSLIADGFAIYFTYEQ